MKKLTIGLKCTPSKIVSATAIGVKKVLITYGGGMGGSHKTYYCTKFDLKKSNGMYVATLTNGDTFEINPTYVVEIKTVVLVKFVTDKTAHANYYNPTVKTSILVEYIELEHGETFVSSSESRGNFDDKRIVISYDENIML